MYKEPAMLMAVFYAAYEQWMLRFCLAGLCALGALVSMCLAARAAKRYVAWARHAGLVSVFLLAFYVLGMFLEGVVTQDDKEEYRSAVSAITAERAVMASIIAPKDVVLSGADNTSALASKKTADGVAKTSDAKVALNSFVQNLRSGAHELSESDYEAGFALAEVRTGEAHDFAAPTNAVWNQDWLGYGGFADNFRLGFGGLSIPFGTNSISALTVFQYGLMRLRTSSAASYFAPMETELGMAPEFRHSILPTTNRPSGFWHCFTPSNSVVFTWRNVLLRRW